MSVVPIYRRGWTISLDNLRGLCGPQVAAVEEHPYFQEYEGWGGICRELGADANSISTDGERHEAAVNVDADATPSREEESRGNDSDAKLIDLLAKLLKAFKEATGGLTLSFEFYDEDGGSGYDIVTHVDGCVFLVDGVTHTAVTPSGSRIQHLVDEQKWMQVG